MEYEFRFFVRGSPDPVFERLDLEDESQARIRGSSELLQMPGRSGVEIWRAGRLIYRRKRQPS